jgi:hypothetical protein
MKNRRRSKGPSNRGNFISNESCSISNLREGKNSQEMMIFRRYFHESGEECSTRSNSLFLGLRNL